MIWLSKFDAKKVVENFRKPPRLHGVPTFHVRLLAELD
jgi:hypothetical protein